MGCDCMLNSNNNPEIVANELNFIKLKNLKEGNFNNYDDMMHSPNKHNKNSSSEFIINDINSKLSKDASYQKGIDSSTKMNSCQPIQHSITIFTSSKIENFKQRLLKEINSAREHPKSFIPKVKTLMNNIIIKSNKYYLRVDYKTNISLLTGIPAFESCLKFLNNQKPIHPLFLKDELALDFPFDNPIECDNHAYLTKILAQKNDEIKKEYMQMITFHYDIVIPNPELSVILQIVDDTNPSSIRRLNIFNEDAHYIGISIGKRAEGIICFYLLFAKDLE